MFRIQLARLGQTMEQGTVVRWLKQLGERMETGDELYEIETEKAVVPVQATRPGRLVRIVAPEGETVPVGALLAVAAEADEQPTAAQIDALAAPDVEQPPPAPPAAVPDAVSGTAAPRVAALPKARSMARELNVDLARVCGTGPDGVITPEDVRTAAAAGDGAQEDASRARPFVRKVSLDAVQRSRIRALEQGWQVPQFTQGTLVDATGLERRKHAAAGALSYMDFFLDALVYAAQQVPEALARIEGDEIVYYREIDVSIATDTQRGLLIPVVRNAGVFDLERRRDVWRSTTERARAGRLSADEMSGGLIALSSLGARGVDYGTALLPAGHAAIVFFGSLEPRALVVDGRLEVRASVHVSITYDHRIIDGVTGSRFTSGVKAALEA